MGAEGSEQIDWQVRLVKMLAAEGLPVTACAQAGGKPLQDQALDQFLPWLPGPTGSQDHDPPTVNPSG